MKSLITKLLLDLTLNESREINIYTFIQSLRNRANNVRCFLLSLQMKMLLNIFKHFKKRKENVFAAEKQNLFWKQYVACAHNTLENIEIHKIYVSTTTFPFFRDLRGVRQVNFIDLDL